MDTQTKEKILILTATALAGALVSNTIKRGLSKMRIRLSWVPSRPGSSRQAEHQDGFARPLRDQGEPGWAGDGSHGECDCDICMPMEEKLRKGRDAWEQIQQALASDPGSPGSLEALDSLLSPEVWLSANGPGRVSWPPDPPPASSSVGAALMPGAGGFLNTKQTEHMMPRPTGLSPITFAKEANGGLAA